jgi:D-arabinose 1-dehydrogenase-like Zn-dependent alcohol dehydrogenase
MQSLTDHTVQTLLIQESVQIALEYLERAGEVEHAGLCRRFLMDSVEQMVRQGVRSRLLLSNRAITQYMRFLEAHTLEAVS